MKKSKVRPDQFLIAFYGVHLGIAIYMAMVTTDEEMKIMFTLGSIAIAIGVVGMIYNMLYPD